MSESIMRDVKYVYGEKFADGKKATVTIKSVTYGAEFFDMSGRKTIGWDIAFVETPKLLGVTGVTVKRQLTTALGTEDPEKMVGKKITLYGVKSAKSATGWAVRVAKAEGGAA